MTEEEKVISTGDVFNNHFSIKNCSILHTEVPMWSSTWSGFQNLSVTVTGSERLLQTVYMCIGKGHNLHHVKCYDNKDKRDEHLWGHTINRVCTEL